MDNKQPSQYRYNKQRWGILRYFFLMVIRLYKKILSPTFGSQCRFYPTCSSYAHLVFTYYPMWRAIPAATLRIFRCNPYHEGGNDFPPGISKEEAKRHLNEIS
ncbi:MAG: membrane protein insertion efficiency factor YidD [Leptospirales bacterium]